MVQFISGRLLVNVHWEMASIELNCTLFTTEYKFQWSASLITYGKGYVL